MRQAWTTGTATLDGEYYQVDGAIVRPLPLQEGGIPLWVAGGGEKVTLRIAAQYAQYTNFAGTPEEFDAKSAIFRAHCESLGTDFDAITRSANYNTVVASTEAEVEDRVAAITDRMAKVIGAVKAEAWRRANIGDDAPGVGTPEQLVERLADMKSRGMTYAIHSFAESAYDRSGIELFEREVIPALS